MIYNATDRRRPNVILSRGDGTFGLFIERRNGEVLECVVDSSDVPLISDRRWYADKGAFTYYAKSTYPTVIKMHQLLLPGVDLIDHIDENGLNNRRSNLRAAIRSVNALNTSRKRASSKTSKFPGVYAHHGKFCATITKDGIKKYLGSFNSERAAYEAYQKAKARL